jgi:predicted nucleic acid-binding protein
MRTVFVDANVFLRFFTADDMVQQRRAADLLHKAASGKVALVTGPPVLFEIAWVLRSAYRLGRENVLDVLDAIVATPGLTLLDSKLVEDAVGVARNSSQEFADAYAFASARKVGADAIATFNRKHFEPMGANLYRL